VYRVKTVRSIASRDQPKVAHMHEFAISGGMRKCLNQGDPYSSGLNKRRNWPITLRRQPGSHYKVMTVC